MLALYSLLYYIHLLKTNYIAIRLKMKHQMTHRTKHLKYLHWVILHFVLLERPVLGGECNLHLGCTSCPMCQKVSCSGLQTTGNIWREFSEGYARPQPFICKVQAHKQRHPLKYWHFHCQCQHDCLILEKVYSNLKISLRKGLFFF